MKVHFLESSIAPALSSEQEAAYAENVTQAFNDARAQLTILPETVNFVVQPILDKPDRLLKNGEHGYTVNSEFITLSYLSARQEDFDLLLKNCRIAVFHELSHAARYQHGVWHYTFLDNCILEGLAVVFARQYGGGHVKWDNYAEKECQDWLTEINKLGSKINRDDYMFKHPDGRQWIGYKVGTYIVDRAIQKSGKSVIDLTSIEGKKILALSEV